MKILHIYAYGIIASEYSDTWAKEFGLVRLKDFVEPLNANSDCEEIHVHINSPGGQVNEGFAIYDFLRTSGKKIKTCVEGYCGSMATIVSLAGEEREMWENSEYFIHSPWAFLCGNAEEVEKQNQELKNAEQKLLNVYAERTGGDRDQILEMMREEKTLTSSQALEMKFITLVPVGAKAFANSIKALKKISNEPTNINTMKTELKAAFTKGIEGYNSLAEKWGWAKITVPNPKPVDAKALDMKIVEGDMKDKILVVDTTGNESESEPKVGNPATIDGTPADGTYKCEDGMEIICVKGVITEIKKEESNTEEVAALKTENSRLKVEIAAEKLAKEETEAAMAVVTSSFNTMLAKVRSGYTPPPDSSDRSNPPGGKAKSRVAIAKEKELAEIEARKK